MESFMQWMDSFMQWLDKLLRPLSERVSAEAIAMAALLLVCAISANRLFVRAMTAMAGLSRYSRGPNPNIREKGDRSTWVRPRPGRLCQPVRERGDTERGIAALYARFFGSAPNAKYFR